MPQIVMMMTEKVFEGLGAPRILDIGNAMIQLVENAFGIKGKNDVAFTAIPAIATINEADIQIEVRYTAGEDEYGQGKPFDPSLENQRLMGSQMRMEIQVMAQGKFGVSIWFKPFYHSVFIG